MKVQWALGEGGIEEYPGVTLPREVSRSFAPRGIVRLDKDDPDDLSRLVCNSDPVARELILRVLVKMVAEPTAYWRSRRAGIELVRRISYQPAIPALERVVLQESGSLATVVPVLGELRAVHSIIRIAREHAEDAFSILEELHWTPAALSLAAMRVASRPPFRANLERLERYSGGSASALRRRVASPTAARGRLLPAVDFPDRLRPGDLSNQGELAWNARFDLLAAFELEQSLGTLEFGDGILEVRDKLLQARLRLDPRTDLEDLQAADRVLLQALAAFDVLRRLGERLAIAK